MKKLISPIVLFILALGVVLYLTVDFSGKKSAFDAEAYLQLRSKIDSLQIAVFEARNQPDVQLTIRGELEVSWDSLKSLQSNSTLQENSAERTGLSRNVWAWIVGGAVSVFICIILLFFALKRHEKVWTQKMEALKEDESRFKEPKNGFDNDPTIAPLPRKHSIIDEAVEYAEKEKASAKVDSDVSSFDKRPQLRPTARERITNAIQSLSDVLRAPKGLSRDRTMKLRAQSHNATGAPTLGASHPLETSRFDRESMERTKILQMSRRGFPASAIATQLKISQEKVEEVIQNALESGN